jgi:hypothetical protein
VGATFQTDKVMVGTLIIAGAGMALTEVLRMIEKRFDAWRPDHSFSPAAVNRQQSYSSLNWLVFLSC